MNLLSIISLPSIPLLSLAHRSPLFAFTPIEKGQTPPIFCFLISTHNPPPPQIGGHAAPPCRTCDPPPSPRTSPPWAGLLPNVDPSLGGGGVEGRVEGTTTNSRRPSYLLAFRYCHFFQPGSWRTLRAHRVDPLMLGSLFLAECIAINAILCKILGGSYRSYAVAIGWCGRGRIFNPRVTASCWVMTILLHPKSTDWKNETPGLGSTPPSPPQPPTPRAPSPP